MKRILIAGAGITGLSAAWSLRRSGVEVTLVEESDRAGGAVTTLSDNGYLVESGPNAMMLDGTDLLGFIHDLGLAGELLEANSSAARRFIVRGGRPHPVPSSPIGALTTRLWSKRGMLRILREPFVDPAPPEADESLADFVVRRLGREMLDYAINPFVAGVYAGDPARLSVRYGFPKLYALEQNHRSLIRGAIRLRRQRRREGSSFRTFLGSFPGGLGRMTAVLADSLGDSLHLKTCLRGVEPAPGKTWLANLSNGEKEWQIEADAILLTLPAHRLAGMFPDLALLAGVKYPPVTTVVLACDRSQVTHPLDGFGMLVPEREKLNILGTLFSSTLFPDRAPEGKVLLTTFVGGTRQPEIAGQPQDELVETVRHDLEKLIGLQSEPERVWIRRWPRAIPQFDLGYGRMLEKMEVFESRHPGIRIAGSARDGIALPKCLRAGLAAGSHPEFTGVSA